MSRMKVARPSSSRGAAADQDSRRVQSQERRSFLRHGAAMAGGALASAAGVAGASAQRLEIAPWTKEMGRIIEPEAYGSPSKFEAHVKRRRSDVLVNRQNWSDWSMTPLQDQLGIVTPNGLFFERHHAGVPDIDPEHHQLVIHGMVRQPLRFSMNDLMRYPALSRILFLECSGNGLTDWTKAASTTVQQSHGLLSCAQWTGIPVATLLDEAGIDPAAKWVLFEGADGRSHARSIPIEKVMADTLLVYGQNGERLRPEQGYPLRLLIPGWEGNVSVKWLRRIKLADAPWHLRSETARYTDPMPGGKWRQFSFVMECKSVITRPSGGWTQRPRHLSDRGLRVVGQRHHQVGRRHPGRRQDLARSGAGGANPRPLSDPLPLRVELGWRPGEDREPRRRQHRLRPAHGRRDRQGARPRRVRAASQRHFPLVDQPGRRGQECGRVSSVPAHWCCCCRGPA